ncbi:MAG TPA: hypothetical protein VK945_11680 [Planococcus sp. (in: firmicutes)]|nr:hypothetical protein [Planococcus sp. (in: firmicutes)]
MFEFEVLGTQIVKELSSLIETWKQKQLFNHRGIIERIDVSHRELVYESPFGMERLVLDEIVAVTLID